MTAPKSTTPFDALTLPAEQVDTHYDQLKLLGILLGQIALLEVATMPVTEKSAAAKVAAARALTAIKETPESIAERLKRSLFEGLTPAELEAIVQALKQGQNDLPAIIAHIKKERLNAP